MATETKLTVYVLEPVPGKRMAWRLVTEAGAMVGYFTVDKEWATIHASNVLESFADRGQPSELKIRKRDGTFGPARTYPRASDPRRSKG